MANLNFYLDSFGLRSVIDFPPSFSLLNLGCSISKICPDAGAKNWPTPGIKNNGGWLKTLCSPI